MKNSFDGLINTVGMAEERISELENVTIETFKTKKQRKKKDKQKNNPKPMDNYKWCNIRVENKGEERNRSNISSNSN